MYKSALIGLMILFFTGCGRYSRGDRYSANFEGDSLVYVVAAKGSGHKIAETASRLRFEHESRGNSCVVKYLTDSASLNDQKGLLFMNVMLPNIEDDFLSKGFIGQFSSKQIVSYILVAYEDVEKYFIEEDKR